MYHWLTLACSPIWQWRMLIIKFYVIMWLFHQLVSVKTETLITSLWCSVLWLYSTTIQHYKPRQPQQPWHQIPWTPVLLLPTELWLEWFSGSAKYWTNALCCKAQSTTQSTELIPLYLVAGHAFNWLLCVVRTRLWDWITWHQQPQRQPLYNDHADSLQEHDTVAFSATHKRGRGAVVNNSNYFTLFQVNTPSYTM